MLRLLIKVIHWTPTDSDRKDNALFVRDLKKFHPCWMKGYQVSLMESIGDKQISMEEPCSICERLKITSPQLHLRVGSCSNEIHQIYLRWADSDRKVHFIFYLWDTSKKISQFGWGGTKSFQWYPSDPLHWLWWNTLCSIRATLRRSLLLHEGIDFVPIVSIGIYDWYLFALTPIVTCSQALF